MSMQEAIGTHPGEFLKTGQPATENDPHWDIVGIAREECDVPADWRSTMIGILPRFLLAAVSREHGNGSDHA